MSRKPHPSGWLGLPVLLLAILSTLSAWSEPPRAAPPDAATLAMLDTVLKVCAPVAGASQGVTYLQDQVQQIAHGASAEVLAQVRGSDAYQSAYGAFGESFDQLDEAGRQQACAAGTSRQP